MKSFLIPQKYQWVLANCQGSLMICLGGEGGGGGNLAVNQHSIQEGEVKLRVASCLGLLLVSLLSSYWESVLPFALEGSVYTVNLFKTY